MGQVKFVSNWEGVESVPENYVCPPEKRPSVPVKKTIPVVDFATNDRALLSQKIIDIIQEFGFFQVINHGVSKRLVEETMSIFKEFLAMSPEEKEMECSKDPNKSCKIYTSSENYSNEQTHYWRDSLIFNCHPLDKYVHFWPENPPKFREVAGAYCVAMRKVASEILDVISEGLGLGKGYFEGEIMNENPMLSISQYPPCPNPSLTMGLAQHSDPSIITILFQDVNGLQFLKDGQWIAVDPVDDALLINMGYLFQMISNGKLKAIEHRVVTNTKTSRQSLAYLVYPGYDAAIEPAKCLINEANPPQYRPLKFKDFRKKYVSVSGDKEVIRKYISFNQA